MELTRWPGIGPKTARRLAIYLWQQPAGVTKKIGDLLQNYQAQISICRQCYNLAEGETCAVCADTSRDRNKLCVVEGPLDIEAIERTEAYRGLYHVLGGVLSPMEGVEEDQLRLRELFQRVQDRPDMEEVILALNTSLESEITARYIRQRLKPMNMKVTRLGRGLPTGGDIEFADEITLMAAFDGRRTYN
jgi:recombination protein RecR